MKFFVFSDNHGSLGQIVEQRHLIGCRGPDCALIILGDGGFNYSGDEYDDRIKNTLDSVFGIRTPSLYNFGCAYGINSTAFSNDL